jgi:hypothetical protein
MSANTLEFLTFIAFVVLWSAGGGLMIKTGIYPIAISVVWFLGFVWGVGVIVSGVQVADRFVLIWLVPYAVLGGLTLLASLIF